jgi:hypothetical protein
MDTITPTRSKRRKYGTTVEKAEHFKAGFADGATDAEILGS